MLKKIIIITVVPFIFFISSCAKKNEGITEGKNKNNPDLLYKVAMLELNNENYAEAKSIFKELQLNYPLSNEAIQSKIMFAFIEYLEMNYEVAIFKFDQILNNYPSHKNIDYVYYMKAMCFYEQIENESLDGNYNEKALESFNQIINRFPTSKYSRESEQKIILIKENIAAKHMSIALFYLNQKKYSASINRYQKIVELYSTSKFTPEALYRLIEIYYSLGIIDDAEKTLAVMSYNYPKSKWTKHGYNLLGLNNENQEKAFIKKIYNLFKNNNDKKK